MSLGGQRLCLGPYPSCVLNTCHDAWHVVGT